MLRMRGGEGIGFWKGRLESGTDGAECSRKVVSGRRVAGATRSLNNARDLQLECASLA